MTGGDGGLGGGDGSVGGLGGGGGVGGSTLQLAVSQQYPVTAKNIHKQVKQEGRGFTVFSVAVLQDQRQPMIRGPR